MHRRNSKSSQPSSPSPSRRILAMFSTMVFVLVSPLTLTFASTLQAAGGQTIQLSPLDYRLPASTSENQPAIRLNASNTIQVQCDGEKYGFNPNVPDCQNARSYYKRSSQLFTYGERHSGHGIGVFPLPYRLMGGKPSDSLKFFSSLYAQRIALMRSVDEALCYFEPVLIDSSLRTGTASINHLSNAAYELILQCAVRQSKGGIATGIGMSQKSISSAFRSHKTKGGLHNSHSSGGENIAVVLGTYQPDVQCRGAFGTWASCRSILGGMPTLTTAEIFGPQENPAVQIPLPQFLASG